MNTALFKKIEAFMQSCLGDSAHDAEHVYRVLYNGLYIAKEECYVNYDVLITACLLHDIGRPEQLADPAVCHAAVGAEKAAVFLGELGMAPDFIQAVSHCIRTHRFSNRMQPETVEAKILFDADKLDVTGALGIARTLQYQGKHNRPLYSVTDHRISDGANDPTPSFFQEYKRKLEKLYDGFYTPSGTALARRQQADAVSFYESLYRQVSAGYEEGRKQLTALLENTP